ERASQESYVGNIYKGRIVNIEPSIQAAFVDFGIGRNGFLHVSDVDPAYYKHLLSKEDLAQYEEDLDREYGGGGGAGREMTSWLEPQKPRVPARPEGFVEDENFAAGLDEEGALLGEPAAES